MARSSQGVADEHGEELRRIDHDPDLSPAGRAKKRAEVERRHVEELVQATHEPFERGLAQLAEREVTLAKMLAGDEPPKVSDTDRLALRLDLQSVLLAARPGTDREWVDLALALVRQRSPVAGSLLRLAALGVRDPLQLGALAGLLEADARPRAVRALVDDKRRLRSSLETRLARRLRARIEEARRLVVERGEPGLARQLLEREL